MSNPLLDWQNCTDFIKSVGFPAFVATYLLIFVHRSLNKLTQCIHELSIAIRSLVDSRRSP